MSVLRKFTLVPAALALLGTLAGTAAQARGPDVHWSVTIGAPGVMLPAPVLHLPVPSPMVIFPAPRPHPVYVPVVQRAVHYREPTRWDVDGDGIPNRHDRLYNPVWDRNGDGIPDRRAQGHHPYGDRDRDGIPNRYDRQDDRRGDRHYDRRDDRGDDRRDDRRGERFDDRPHAGDWRGPR